MKHRTNRTLSGNLQERVGIITRGLRYMIFFFSLGWCVQRTKKALQDHLTTERPRLFPEQTASASPKNGRHHGQQRDKRFTGRSFDSFKSICVIYGFGPLGELCQSKMTQGRRSNHPKSSSQSLRRVSY